MNCGVSNMYNYSDDNRPKNNNNGCLGCIIIILAAIGLWVIIFDIANIIYHMIF